MSRAEYLQAEKQNNTGIEKNNLNLKVIFDLKGAKYLIVSSKCHLFSTDNSIVELPEATW